MANNWGWKVGKLHKLSVSLIIRLHYERETSRNEDVGVMMYVLRATGQGAALLLEVSFLFVLLYVRTTKTMGKHFPHMDPK